jgi:hypothetical protein
MKRRRQDLDSPWKDILHRYFQEFMEFFFPTAHEDIDWSRGYEFLDKEFQKIVRDAELGRRLLDKLVKVWRKDGEEAWVLAHVEIQGREEEDFAKRIYIYNYRIFDRYDRPVASLVILADEHLRWHPRRFGYSLWGCEASLKFPAVKLRDFEADWETLETSSNPFSVVVMAHLKTMATRDDPANRLNWKLGLVKMLYERGYSRQDVIELFRFIDWLMVLPEELEQSFSDAVFAHEETIRMPYVTSIERKGLEKGRMEGRMEGRVEGRVEGRIEMSREALLDIFEARFKAPAPASIMELVDRIEDASILKLLLKRIATASTPEEFTIALEKLVSS